MCPLIVGDIALESAYGDGLLLQANGVDTATLTLLLLWANTTTDSRERTGLSDDPDSLEHLSSLDELNKRRDMDTYGTALHTAWVGAV